METHACLLGVVGVFAGWSRFCRTRGESIGTVGEVLLAGVWFERKMEKVGFGGSLSSPPSPYAPRSADHGSRQYAGQGNALKESSCGSRSSGLRGFARGGFRSRRKRGRRWCRGEAGASTASLRQGDGGWQVGRFSRSERLRWLRLRRKRTERRGRSRVGVWASWVEGGCGGETTRATW